MIQAGLSAEEVLTSATTNGAMVLGKDNELGSLKKGKLADLVILNANPLVSPQNLSDIYLVMNSGKVIGP